ncbi:MAG TPA: tetratricopeptide repeat protein [Spirochaetia bacterium]|nr:tetratricopeptide repeat protein [Spirochaetia bacterium]
MKRILAVFLFVTGATALFAASDYFTRGEALFVQNKPQDARPLLESALTDDPSNEKTYLYLGIIYQQLGDTQKAIDVLKKGLDVSTTYKELFYYNIGNDLYAQRDFAGAEAMYSSAVGARKDLAEGYLNRANARLKQQNLDGSLSDYAYFLQLAPQDPQRPAIEKLMGLLRKVQDQKEAARQAELARQQALLNDVQKGLTNAGDSTKNLSVESINGQTDPVNVDIKD